MVSGLLFDPINPEPAREHRYVPDTSKAQHRAAINNGRIGKRGAEVLLWLTEWTAKHQDAPTSAELAHAHHWQYPGKERLWVLLHVRRGLNDLLAKGLVCKGADRECTVARDGLKANTWKVATR